MFKNKKVFGAITTAIMVACLSFTAFAASNSKSVSGYGTLYGSLSKSGSYVTSVTKNPDKAYLTIGGTIQDKDGKTLVKQQTIKSPRGSLKLNGSWNNIPSKAYAIYGSHGVQGGSKYGPAAVYTYTKA